MSDFSMPNSYIVPSARWVRAVFNGVTVADSRRTLLVRSGRPTPVYYFPRSDVRQDLFVPGTKRIKHPELGIGHYWALVVGDRRAENAVWAFEGSPDNQLDDYVAFDWDAMDHWYEEADEVFVHARDPYSRVDAIPSSRHVRIIVGGEVIAESRRPVLVFETRLPIRYYLPPEDVRLDLLTPTDTVTRCPYKGTASYWCLTSDPNGRDLVWSYPDPIAEMPKLRGLMAFFNERVDALYVDGELQEKPKTPWA